MRGNVTNATADRPTEATATAVVVETMKAVVQDSYGSDPEAVLQIAEVAKPTIGSDEILVAVRAASVDRGTWHVMAGLPYPIRLAGFGLRRPKGLNPGRAVAGLVESIGPNAKDFQPAAQRLGG